MSGEIGKANSKSYTGLLPNVTTPKTDQEKENPGRVKSLCRAEKSKAAEPVVPLAHRFGMNTWRHSHFPEQDVSCLMLVSANENHTARVVLQPGIPLSAAIFTVISGKLQEQSLKY